MTDLPDHYQVLGVRADASAATIRSAYVALMKRCHPDRAGGNAKVEDHARLVTSAYRCLCDPERRLDYDDQRRSLRRSQQRRSTSPARAAQAARSSRRRRYLPPARQRVPAAAFSLSVLLVAIGVAWAANSIGPRSKPVRETLSVIRDLPAVPSASRLALVEDAVFDLEAIRGQFGSTGAERYVDQCFGELAGSTSRTFLDYCLALDAAAALGASPSERRAFFSPAARAARIGAISSISPAEVEQRRRAIESAVALAMKLPSASNAGATVR